MLILQRILQHLQKRAYLFNIIILPFYFARFVFYSLKERSLWFYRYPMGHYGSTIPSKREILLQQNNIFNKSIREIPGLDLNIDYQLELLKNFTDYDGSYNLNKNKSDNRRYYYNNFSFRLSDALILYYMCRHFNPAQVIEIGSGYSSALMLDIKESFLNNMNLTFIEPYPSTLNRLLRINDLNNCVIIQKKIQDVSLEIFDELERDSILFIDSSHVLKIGSDLSTIVFSIFPRLKPGVLIHIHDVFWPFEYPEKMISEGRIWNEIYFIRSFLQFNNSFEIVFFTSFLEQMHRDKINKIVKNHSEGSGASLWLRKKN